MSAFGGRADIGQKGSPRYAAVCPNGSIFSLHLMTNQVATSLVMSD
jgi:hypothetical protein